MNDAGMFCAMQDQIDAGVVLSLNTGILYDINDVYNVRIIGTATDAEVAAAKECVEDDGPCWYGDAGVLENNHNGKLIWDY